MVARAFLVAVVGGSGCRARAMVARAFLVAVVVGLEQWLLEHSLAVVVGLEQWLLEYFWWQWL